MKNIPSLEQQKASVPFVESSDFREAFHAERKPDDHTPEPWQANRFSNVNGDPHASNADVAETLKYSAMQSESAELFGASKDELVVFYTGNGPRSRLNAMRIVECVNACAGMQDPAAEIEAMRAAIREAHDAIDQIHKPLGDETATSGNPCCGPKPSQGRALAAALAKLKPFLP